eukprot:961413-Prorocentrum_minimum.AAC.1
MDTRRLFFRADPPEGGGGGDTPGGAIPGCCIGDDIGDGTISTESQRLGSRCERLDRIPPRFAMPPADPGRDSSARPLRGREGAREEAPPRGVRGRERPPSPPPPADSTADSRRAAALDTAMYVSSNWASRDSM